MMGAETPNIRSVRPGQARALVVTWKSGIESTVDVAKHLFAYAVLKPLADDALFAKVQVGEWGWSVCWPDARGTDDLEISADTLWRLALEQGAAWLKAWRNARRMTQAQAAKALGVSPRMWRYYEAGTHLLPKTVRLACFGLDAEARAA
jgi:hypothetical protein